MANYWAQGNLNQTFVLINCFSWEQTINRTFSIWNRNQSSFECCDISNIFFRMIYTQSEFERHALGDSAIAAVACQKFTEFCCFATGRIHSADDAMHHDRAKEKKSGSILCVDCFKRVSFHSVGRFSMRPRVATASAPCSRTRGRLAVLSAFTKDCCQRGFDSCLKLSWLSSSSNNSDSISDMKNRLVRKVQRAEIVQYIDASSWFVFKEILCLK